MILTFFMAGGLQIRCECISIYRAYIFGANNSPPCANYVLRRTAVKNQDRYHEAAYAVLNFFYIDDYLGSVKKPEMVLLLCRSVVEPFTLDWFKLTFVLETKFP